MQDGTKVVSISGETPTIPGEVLIRREQIAAQIVAIMRAHFSRPEPQEMKEILRVLRARLLPYSFRRLLFLEQGADDFLYRFQPLLVGPAEIHCCIPAASPSVFACW